MTRRLPDTASVAHGSEDARLYAPAAERNAGPLCDLLARHAPATGPALELASGTGQHVVAFARRLPGFDWQPTEIAAERRASIDAHVASAGLANVRPALALDATAPGWAAAHSGQALIVLVNLLHLIGAAEARTVIAEAAAAVAAGGRLVLYGPFRRSGELTSAGDAAFHASLVAADPEIGYKDDRDIKDWIRGAGLDLIATVEMPANNLALVAEKPAI